MGKFNELKRIPVSPRHAFPRLSKACGATQAREEDSETYAAAERPPNSSGIFSKQQSDQAPAQMEAMMPDEIRRVARDTGPAVGRCEGQFARAPNSIPTHTVPTDANEPGPRRAEELFRACAGAMAGGKRE